MAKYEFNGIENAKGLTDEMHSIVAKLSYKINDMYSKNNNKFNYYRGTNKVDNLGYALPNTIDSLNVSCGWGKKAITSISDRSILESITAENEDVQEKINKIFKRNNLSLKYAKALPSELIVGCTFAKVSKNEYGVPCVRFHSPMTASAEWSDATDGVECAMFVMDYYKPNTYSEIFVPTVVHVEVPYATWILRYSGNEWSAECMNHASSEPLVDVLVNRPTDVKQFGMSRLNASVRCIIDDYVRGMIRLIYASEIYTSPQKVLLGVSDKTFDMDKMEGYLTNFLMVTKDEEGDTPQMLQFAGQQMQPLIDVMLFEAKQFCNNTNIPLNEMSIVTDTPSSADAIIAQKEQLITDVEFLNKSNGYAIKSIMSKALAIENNCSLEDLTDDELNIDCKFTNPAMSSLAAQTDAMVKIASVDPAFAGTNEFYAGIGFDADTIRRIQSDKNKNMLLQSYTANLQGAINGNNTKKSIDAVDKSKS